MLAIKTRYTFADLLEQEPGDETLYEILGGELVVFSSPNNPHASVVTELMLYVGDAQRAGYGIARTAPCAVAFDFAERGDGAEDVTHPDVFFVRKERHEILGFQCVEAAPDLVIEVLSPTTRRLDLPGGDKFAIYERYGVPYYWVVDVVVRAIAQYTWRDGRYGEPVTLRSGDTLSCPTPYSLTPSAPAARVLGCSLFPDISCPVDQIFASIR